MPLTVDEVSIIVFLSFGIINLMCSSKYRIGQLYSTMKHALEETGGGEGIEVLENRPFSDEPQFQDGRFNRGQFTHKRVYIGR